jgi:hypothetical protein
MNIGILTFHRAYNYGAILQAYALKTHLDSLGHQAELIDYWPEYRKGQYGYLNTPYFQLKKPLWKKIIRIILDLLEYPFKRVKYTHFVRFINTNLGIDDKNTITKAEHIPSGYDLYVYGSDQIWRYNNFVGSKGFDWVFWGKYPATDSLKITYAASMGKMEFPDEDIHLIKDQLKNFVSISVREKALKKLIQPLTSKQVYQVLDPVFLLEKEKWELFISKSKKRPSNYILLYDLFQSPTTKILARKLASRHNCEIVEITGEIILSKLFSNSEQTCGPIEFLNLIYFADSVVSSSFHGVAFSLIFKKQFFALGMKNNSERVTSLLNSLAISERYLDDIKSDEFFYKDIDYQSVDEKLDNLRLNSNMFLTNSIKK